MFFLLPLIGAAVGATIGAIVVDDWAESDREAARHHGEIENAKYSDLQKQFYEVADTGKELAKEQNKKLAAMNLENSYLDIALELSCSLATLSQQISINPTYESLSKLKEAIEQTNKVLLKLDKQPISVSQDYSTKNFAVLEKQKLSGGRVESHKIIKDSNTDLSILENNRLTKFEKLSIMQLYELVDLAMDSRTDVLIETLEEIDQRLTNIRFPSFVFEQLSEKKPCIRSLIAKCSRCPVHILDKLSLDPDSTVRHGVLGNSKTPLLTIQKIVYNNGAEVDLSFRKTVAANRLITPDILAKLSKDSSSEVRKLVAIHPSTSLEVLENLFLDSDSSVSKEVETNPRYCIKAGIYSNIDLSGSTLIFRKELAKNPSTKSDILIYLSNDRSSEVRKLVAKHSSTSIETLRKLVKSKNIDVRTMAKNALKKRNT